MNTNVSIKGKSFPLRIVDHRDLTATLVTECYMSHVTGDDDYDDMTFFASPTRIEFDEGEGYVMPKDIYVFRIDQIESLTITA